MHRTRTRTLAAIAGIRSYWGPARRDGAGDGPGSGTADGGGGTGDNTGGEGDSTGKAGEGDTGKPNIDGDLDKDRAARAIQSAREGEKKAKAEAKAERDKVAAILKAMGLSADGKTDPAEQLKTAADERDKIQQKYRNKSLQAAILEHASKAGADPTAVKDSLTFRDSVADLDPDAADYEDQVVAAMKKAVKANPKLGAAPAAGGPGKQGADHTGGSGGTVTQKQFNAMNLTQRSELYRTNPSLYKQLAGN